MYTRKNEQWRLEIKLNIEFWEDLIHMVSGWQGCERVLHASPARFTKAASPARKYVGVKKWKKPHIHAGVCFVSCSKEPVMSCTE